MKPIKHAAIAAAVLLAVSGVAVAADVPQKPVKAPAKTGSKAPVRPAPPPLPLGDDAGRNHPGQIVYQVLLGEVALQRGNIGLAVDAYADLAYRTRDPKVLERATELASYARRLDVAYETSRLWLEVEPASMNARQTLAAILILQGKADELGPQIAYLLERDKENLGDNLMRLNRMLARFPDKAAAYQMLRKVLVPYDGIAEAHYALATAALHAGERQAALDQVRKALALRPDWDQAALFEAQVLARDSSAAALESLERFVRANPGARDVRLQLARALVAEKRYDDARRHFSRLLADNPDSPELIYPVAVLALQQNDVATAQPLLEKVLAGGDASERSVAAFYLGQIAEDRGAAGDAISLYRQVATGDQYAPAQIRVANLLLRQGGGMSMARAHLQESAKRYPPAQTQFSLAEAQLLREAGNEAEAFLLLEQALAQQPNQPDVLYDAALLAEKLGRMDVVEANLRRVITLRPDSAHAYNALGYSFADRGIRLDEARTLIAKAHELAPEDPFIMDSMGWVLFKQGDLQGALDYLRRAYALRADAEIAAHLGEVLWLLDRRDEARSAWADAAKRHPDNEVLNAVRRKYQP
jgi:tetratricopeptide (TPR) repeat protein